MSFGTFIYFDGLNPRIYCIPYFTWLQTGEAYMELG